MVCFKERPESVKQLEGRHFSIVHQRGPGCAGKAHHRDSVQKTALRDIDVLFLDIHADAISATTERRRGSTSSAAEGIKHSVASKGEHANQALGQAYREWGRMALAGGLAANIEPAGTGPALHFFAVKHRERSLNWGRRAVLPALSEKEDVLDIVFDNGARLVRFAVKASAVALDLGNAIGDFLPEDGCQTIQA